MAMKSELVCEPPAAADETDDPLVTCAVCQQMPSGIIVQCPNGHIICGDPLPVGTLDANMLSLEGHCLAKVRKTRGTGCPTCREPFAPAPPRSLVAEQCRDRFKARLLMPPLTCPHGNCGKRIAYNDLETHLRACFFRPGAVLSAVQTRAYGVLAELVHAGADTNEVCKLLGHTALVQACSNRDSSAVKILLAAERTKVNGVCEKLGRTALFFSVALGDVASVKLLLSRIDVDIHKRDNCNVTPFFHVGSRGTAYRNRGEIMQLLLQAGADVNGVCSAMNRTVLHHAAADTDTILMESLLAMPGIDVNKKDSRGVTPVMRAAAHKYQDDGGDMVRLLVSAGADINTVPLTDVHAMLAWSASRGWPGAESVQVLLTAQGVNVNHQNKYGDSLVFSAAAGGHLDMLKQLVDRGGDVLEIGRLPAQIAFTNEHYSCYQFLEDSFRPARLHRAAVAAAASRSAKNAAASAAVLKRRATSRSLDSAPQADAWSAPGGDYHERVTLPATAALEQASKLLAPAIAARLSLRSPAAFEGFACADESDSDDESYDATGGRNGEDSDSDSYSDNNSEDGADEDVAAEDASELTERVRDHSEAAVAAEAEAVAKRPRYGLVGYKHRRTVQRLNDA
jgi:ankyrin repeat protein